jgi:hypothetical protein
MKKHLSKIISGFLMAGMFLSVNIAVAQTANTKTPTEQQIKKATELTERVASAANLTAEQKTKVQASMVEAVMKFNDAVIKAKKEDESKLATVNADLLADISARLKIILTADQYTRIMGDKGN